jgi:hypothetical protein
MIIYKLLFIKQFWDRYNLIHLPRKRHRSQSSGQSSKWFDKEDLSKLLCERKFSLARGQLIQVLKQIDVLTELIENRDYLRMILVKLCQIFCDKQRLPEERTHELQLVVDLFARIGFSC